ncbi:hypothetical protein OAD96_00410 [Pseudomonadales bacterium]|nr:hypothetical protein [Pseudomonadales bacterium]MDA9297697.1 hypothetical protein [Pseudomonadales bacterium]MDB9942512.1 hypothetical protein [Pseudomonadales bacterium]MDC0013453.1 hypothetical protein [Pseudomonadales bacterium]
MSSSWSLVAIAQTMAFVPPQAQGANDMAEQRLAAARNALLDRALNGELEIVTSAFVDESGELHEATYMASNGTVRGVRVADYLAGDRQSPALAAEIIGQVDVQTCRQSRYRRQAVLYTRIGADLKSSSQSIHEVGRVIRESVIEEFGADQGWLVTSEQAYASEYDRSLRGTGDQAAALRIEIRVEESQAGVLTEGYYNVRKSLKSGLRYIPLLGYRPDATARSNKVRYQLRLVDIASGKVVFDRDEMIGFTDQLQGADADLPLEILALIDAATSRQVNGLRTAAKCLPNSFLVTRSARTSPTLLLKSGSLAGMTVGDEFLLSSSRDLHNVVLNGDGINHLGLGRITRVNDFSSVVEVVAGEKRPVSDYVAALPF